jgi:hypothetical protein
MLLHVKVIIKGLSIKPENLMSFSSVWGHLLYSLLFTTHNVVHMEKNFVKIVHFFFVKGPAADATDAPQPWGLLCKPVMKIISFFVLPCNGAPVEWNWQGKTEVLGDKPVPVPLCEPKIPHGLTRERNLLIAFYLILLFFIVFVSYK